MKPSKEQFFILHSLLTSVENDLIEKLEINFNGKIDLYARSMSTTSAYDMVIKGNPSISFELVDQSKLDVSKSENSEDD